MEQFILVREYGFTTPLVMVYTSKRLAEESFARDFGGVTQVTLYQSQCDTLGWDQPIELVSRKVA